MASTQALDDIHYHGICLKNREIFLHSHYQTDEGDEEPGVDYRQATTFIKNLLVLDQKPFKPILVHLHSIGGCWDNGMAVFNSVELAKSPTTMLAYAQASSMSGIILQSARLRLMMPDCYFLMHHGAASSNFQHPFASMNESKLRLGICERMLRIFAKRALVGEFFRKRKSSTENKAYAFFDKKLKEEVDWYLSAAEAYFYGLADGILGTPDYPDVYSLRDQS